MTFLSFLMTFITVTLSPKLPPVCLPHLTAFQPESSAAKLRPQGSRSKVFSGPLLSTKGNAYSTRILSKSSVTWPQLLCNVFPTVHPYQRLLLSLGFPCCLPPRSFTSPRCYTEVNRQHRFRSWIAWALVPECPPSLCYMALDKTFILSVLQFAPM